MFVMMLNRIQFLPFGPLIGTYIHQAFQSCGNKLVVQLLFLPCQYDRMPNAESSQAADSIPRVVCVPAPCLIVTLHVIKLA